MAASNQLETRGNLSKASTLWKRRSKTAINGYVR
jgi:hypothetical protein